MSLLCLDCGNTRLKWGLRDGAAWRDQGAVPTADIGSLGEVFARMPGPTRAIACNVAGPVAQAALAELAAALGVGLTWSVAVAQQCGVNNGYQEPGQLGADRWAALIGARALRSSACLVVLAGTATTVDLLDSGGRFRGGLILPGIALMRASLAANTARLPEGGGSYSELPRNTADAVASGCLEATAGAVDRAFARIATEAHAICLVSGGNARALAPLLHMPFEQIDNLVLEGLARMALDDPGLPT